MLAKRIIPCLDIKDGQTVKGVFFENLRHAGDPVELAAAYAQQGADELVLLDITATVEARKTLVDLVHQVAAVLDIPFTVGGGIQSVAQVGELLQAGADKISVNSAAVRRPELIRELAGSFGSQCVVLAAKAAGPTSAENGMFTSMAAVLQQKSRPWNGPGRLSRSARGKFCSPLWRTTAPKTALRWILPAPFRKVAAYR